MKRVLSSMLMAALGATVAFASTGSIEWRKSYAAATAEAKSSGKLLMVALISDQEDPSKPAGPDPFALAGVVDLSAKFVPIKLDGVKNSDGFRLTVKLGVRSYPTVLFLDLNEELAFIFFGDDAQDLVEAMAKVALIPNNLRKLKAKMDTNPSDFDALASMAIFESSTGKNDQAAAHVDAASKAVSKATRGKLLTAYIAVGDGFQLARKYDKAIGYFLKAIATGFDSETAYARMSIGVCYFQSQKYAKAKPYLADLLKMPRAPKEYADQAKQLIVMCDQMSRHNAGRLIPPNTIHPQP